MRRIASWPSEIEAREGRTLEELTERIGGDVLSWLQGGIQEWDCPEPEHTPPIRTTLLIKSELHANGVLLSIENGAEALRLASLLETYVRESLRRTGRDPAQACPLRVSILSDEQGNSLEVFY